MSNDIVHWIKFFLSATIETANKGKITFQGILKLRQEMDAIIPGYGKRAENLRKLLDRLYNRSVVTANQAASLLNISHQTASSLIKKMMEDGILEEYTGYQRNRVFIFKRYLQLFID